MPAFIPVAALLLQLASPVAAVDTGRPVAPMPNDSAVSAVRVDVPVIPLVAAPLDTPRARPVAIEYSDWYARRLAIHRYASYAILPLFAAEYSLGQNLINDSHPAKWMRPTHAAVAGTIGGLFVLNTVTGAWNLWDARHDPEGRTLRVLHTVLMLGADAGFTWSGISGYRATHSGGNRRQHRTIALASVGVATAGTAMMWLFNR